MKGMFVKGVFLGRRVCENLFAEGVFVKGMLIEGYAYGRCVCKGRDCVRVCLSRTRL